MRRPRFQSWARSELLKATGSRSFNLRKLAARAQAGSDESLTATLLLYAYESNCLDRLMSYIYDADLKHEYSQVIQHIGKRSVERLALRGTPLMTLPAPYRAVFKAYEEAYYAPERIEEEKRSLQQSSNLAMLQSGGSPADIARDLNLNYENLHAYLVRGEIQRFTLDTIRTIDTHLQFLANEVLESSNLQ